MQRLPYRSTDAVITVWLSRWPVLARTLKARLLERPVSRLRIVLLVSIPFWTYAAIVHVLWVEMIVWRTGQDLAPPPYRFLQHALLWAAFVPICMTALRIGLPRGGRVRALAAQAALAVGFCALARPFFILTGLLGPDRRPLALGSIRGLLEGAQSEYALWLQVSLNCLAVYLLGLVSCVAAEAYLRLRDEKLYAANLETRWYKARLDAVIGRLNPHFLFNALHTISALVRVAPERADRLIADLSDLLRKTVTLEGDQTVPLHEELEFVRQYLSIELVRFEDRLRIDIDVPDEVGDALVPRLFLQPLIENAIQRGIAPSVKPGWIALGARRDGQNLEIRIINTCPEDGVGPGGTGLGMAATRDRLSTLYGKAFSFDARAREGCWHVLVRLPFRTLADCVSPARAAE